jgi:multicomponent Na+:H+ antiporter subunit C
MAVLLGLAIGCLYAAGTYMLLRRSLFKLIMGLVLLSHGANLLIFTMGLRLSRAGLERQPPPIIPPSGELPVEAVADPLPQALILTAIVIGFGVVAFALVLFHRAYQSIGSDDPDDLRATDR